MHILSDTCGCTPSQKENTPHKIHNPDNFQLTPPAHFPYQTTQSTNKARLQALLQERILFLDGAMGTEIQNYKLAEADYRGKRFADFAYDVKGNNDLSSITWLL